MDWTEIDTEKLRNDHLNECHPEPDHHPGCPLCTQEGRSIGCEAIKLTDLIRSYPCTI